MERLSVRDRNQKKLFSLGAATLVLLLLLGAPLVRAGTILAPVEQDPTTKPDGEPYAESRFGRAPAPIEPGIRKGYASRAVEEIEQVEDEAPPARAPAGMLFGYAGGPAGARSRQSVRTAANSAAISRISESSERSPSLPVESDGPRSRAQLRLPETSQVFRKGVQEASIIASDLGFFPKAVFVTRDVPVRLFVTGASKNTLCIMMDSFGVRKQIRAQRIEEITFTPSTPGQYRFYCPVNGMEGSLIVRELSSAAPVSEASAEESEPTPGPAMAQPPAARRPGQLAATAGTR